MNKKLITLAVAAAMTAPAAALAEATLYGKLNVSIDYFDIDATPFSDGYNGWTLNRGKINNGSFVLPGVFPVPGGSGRANRIGVKGSEDLGGGLKAIYQVEFGVPLANEEDNNIWNGDKGGVYMRNTFVGLAGNFGTFLVGRHDTPFKISTGKLDLFSDTIADYNGTVGFQDIRADNAIAYISPSWSGFQFAAALVPGGASTTSGAYNEDSDSIAEGWSLAAIYSNGPFYGSVAFERLEKNLIAQDLNNDGVIADFDVVDPATAQVITVSEVGDDPYDKWRVGVGLLDWNGFTLDGIWEYQDYGNIGNTSPNNQLWQVQAAYAFGNNSFKGMFGQGYFDPDATNADDVDHTTWALGVDHNFSKRTRAYMVYTDVDYNTGAIADWEGFSLGMVHKF